jgi:hypothetical protein
MATVNGRDYCRSHLQWQTFITHIHIELWLNAYFRSIKCNTASYYTVRKCCRLSSTL